MFDYNSNLFIIVFSVFLVKCEGLLQDTTYSIHHHTLLLYLFCSFLLMSESNMNTFYLLPSDVLKITPSTHTCLVPIHMHVSDLNPSSSCVPQRMFISNAKSGYVQTLTQTPHAAVHATEEWLETWGQTMTVKLWSWVPSHSKVSSSFTWI